MRERDRERRSNDKAKERASSVPEYRRANASCVRSYAVEAMHFRNWIYRLSLSVILDSYRPRIII